MANQNKGKRVLCVVLASAFLAFCMAGVPAEADERYPERGLLERRDWWPYATGPHYGEVPEELRFHPRTIRMQVGSFDTRGPGLAIPEPLKLSEEESRSPLAPWLVQLQGPINEVRKEMLRKAGVMIYRFLPMNTFIVRAKDPMALKQLPGVLWTGPCHPAYRIEPALGHAPTADPEKARNERISVRVRLFEPDEKKQVIERLQKLGALIDFAATMNPHDLPNRIYFTATPQMILEAARMNEVLWVEEILREGFALNAESKVVLQSGYIDGGTPMWNAGVDGRTQIVGVMDSGLDVDTILVSNTETDAGTPGPEHRKVRTYSAWGGGDTATCAGTSGYTHGTNTTQCAVGNRSDFPGQSGNLEGIAKEAKVVFQDVGPTSLFACLLGSLSPPSTLLDMYDEIRNKGGHLTNGSFAICSYGTYGSHASDADQYTWDHKDFLSFFSAGNGGSGNACPGTNKNNISSGGHYQDPFENEHYGSYGPGPDNRVGPTVLGPACDHANGNSDPFNFDTSTSIQSNDNDITGPPAGDEGINQGACGTSFSSPYLMGAAALIRDYFEQGFYPSGTANAGDQFAPSGALVKATLINSGDFVENCTGCVKAGLMGSMGMGRVNLSNTLAIACDLMTASGVRVIDKGMDIGLATGEIFKEQIEITDNTEEFRATLVWVDQEGSTLTNDLRLTVIGPDGTSAQTYFGNNFPASSTGKYSLSMAAGGTTDDHTNVFESVRVNPAELVTGVWTLKVEGTNVPMGDPNFGNSQPFALIAAGGFETPPGEVSPSGSTNPLRVTESTGTEITWEWENNTDACSYSFYRGTLGSLRSGIYDHQMIDAAHCNLQTNTTIVSDRADGVDSYYLVTGRKRSDGTLGFASDGSERPPAAPACP